MLTGGIRTAMQNTALKNTSNLKASNTSLARVNHPQTNMVKLNDGSKNTKNTEWTSPPSKTS